MTGFPCYYCPCNSATSYNERRHQKRVHPDLPFFRYCKICKDHVSTEQSSPPHTHAVDNTCKTCGISFTRPFRLKKHVEERHDKPRVEYSCNFCRKEFPSQEKYSQHISSEHEKGLHGFKKIHNSGFTKLHESIDLICDSNSSSN